MRSDRLLAAEVRSSTTKRLSRRKIRNRTGSGILLRKKKTWMTMPMAKIFRQNLEPKEPAAIIVWLDSDESDMVLYKDKSLTV
jgi:hypothetical protein